jgi:invasion protein IalB
MCKRRFFGNELLLCLLLFAGVAGAAGAQSPAAKPNHAGTSPAAPAERKSNVAPPVTRAQQLPNVNLQEATSTGWTSKCTSESRRSPVECTIEQSAVLANTGQVVTMATVRVPSDSHQPLLMIQVPIGLYLPAGLNLQIDENKSEPLALQTCDLKGCYTATQLSPELLGSMKTGKRLAITFQNLARNDITVRLTLDNFAEAYKKIE